jgi:hypothetical protein
MFDVYQAWLGIPKEQQPCTFYQLLWLAPQEKDRKVIEEAVIRQTTRVRVYQSGQYARECSNLLNHIAEAGMVLLDPVKRKKYDEQLLHQQQLRQAPAVVTVAAPAPVPAAPVAPAPLPSSAGQAGSAPGQWNWPWQKLVVLGAALVFFVSGFLLFVLAWWLRRR